MSMFVNQKVSTSLEKGERMGLPGRELKKKEASLASALSTDFSPAQKALVDEHVWARVTQLAVPKDEDRVGFE